MIFAEAESWSSENVISSSVHYLIGEGTAQLHDY